MSKKQSRTTKAVLASLLATSAIVPAMAVSADTTGSQNVNGTDATTRTVPDGKYTADFTIDNAEVAKYVKGPAIVTVKDGKYYVDYNVSASMIGYVTAATVGGKSIIVEADGKKKLEVEVASITDPIVGKVTLNIPFGNIGEKTFDLKLTLDPTTFKKVETEAPAEEKPAKPFVPGKTFTSVKEGTYDITFDAYDPKTNEGNYKLITNHFSPNAKLIVENGKYAVQIELAEKSNPMIAGIKVGDVEATTVSGVATEGTRVMQFPIDSISELTKASVHVVVEAMKMDKSYDFGFAINTANLELPVADAKPETPKPAEVTVPVYVYKDGTNEISTMKEYLGTTAKITSTAGGKSVVEVSFPKAQYLNAFTVEGATVAETSSETVGDNTVKLFTVEVEDITKIYTANVDVSVHVGPVNYDSKYDVQLQFGGKENPFTDVMTAGNYGAIVALYSDGIFKSAEKFNPGNNVKRSQFALMLNRALELTVPASTSFTDIKSYDAETQNAIKALNGYGVINGKSATSFAPNQEITRKQAALMIYRLLVKEGYKATGTTADFSDVTFKDAEAVTAIAELNKLGVMTGYQGKFSPENNLTRNQMAKVLNNTLQVIDGLK